MFYVSILLQFRSLICSVNI